ncbi:hypothetical protein [Aureimonas sp. N4]|uniref:hypothetical protein n=1 Tax=Aureimonas sp. N4 TaxID=1638165 RepID=UPI0012E3570B|nr:hypothetical protein [Aureimonas sp. N4]
MAQERETRRYRRLTDQEWVEIDAAWGSGSVTLAELSESYNVAIRTLQNGFAARGITKGAPTGGFDVSIPVVERTTPSAIPTGNVVVAAIEVRDRTTANTREVGARLMAAVRALEADTTVRPAAAIRTLAVATSALEKLHAIEHRALGLDGAQHLMIELPSLVLRDISTGEIEEIQRGTPLEEEDDEIAELTLA